MAWKKRFYSFLKSESEKCYLDDVQGTCACRTFANESKSIQIFLGKEEKNRIYQDMILLPKRKRKLEISPGREADYFQVKVKVV